MGDASFSGKFGIMPYGSRQPDTARMFFDAVIAALQGMLYCTGAMIASVGAGYAARQFAGLTAIVVAVSCCCQFAAKAAVIGCYAALVRYSNKLGRCTQASLGQLLGMKVRPTTHRYCRLIAGRLRRKWYLKEGYLLARRREKCVFGRNKTGYSLHRVPHPAYSRSYHWMPAGFSRRQGNPKVWSGGWLRPRRKPKPPRKRFQASA